MSTQNLEHLFRPKSVAVVGASNRPQSVGAVVIRNLLQGGFNGPIMPVNPKHQAIAGVLAYKDIDALPTTPELAVICTPPATIPELIDKLGERGTRAAIVITAGLDDVLAEDGRSIKAVMLEKAKAFRMRLLGPNCLGLLVPGIGLNASFSHVPADKGKIAFVSQSGALGTVVLDWARSRGIGFSIFASLGDASDIDFGHVLDYLSTDPNTRAILLYIESIKNRRNFMSAARSAARNKPVLVIKAGRVAESAKAAASHTGALAGMDNVFDAAIARSGMLRVFDFNELFAAVEILDKSNPLKGEKLAIMTNGGGPGVMAVDALIEDGGELVELSEETIEKLNAVLPRTWSHSNPIDIIGDAPGSRYADALKILLNAKEVDAVAVMHAPTAIASSTEAAQAVIDTVLTEKRAAQIPILTNWLGEGAVAEARDLFSKANIPTFRTPEWTVRAFMHMVRYRRNQEMLMETPKSAPSEFTPATATARLVIENALSNNRSVLTEPEAKAVFSAYGIPTVETHIARNPESAAALATQMGFPVALKILSTDITHKSDVGGVVLDLDNEDSVKGAAINMLKRASAAMPDAVITGFTVQKMASRSRAHELIVGMTTDPIFGPVILFGEGGTAVEVIADRAVALPPLNMSLARELISRTRISKLLKGFRDQPPANIDAICLTLMQIAQLVIEIPEITDLDINPLFADQKGVLAVDARIGVEPLSDESTERLAIRPYPQELEERITLKGRDMLIRPIRPEDEVAHHEFISRVSPEDMYMRFFGSVRELPHSQMARFTQIDYHREMAFIAGEKDAEGKWQTLGVVRVFTDPDNEYAEYSILIRSDLQGYGLGRKLMEKILDYCRSRGTKLVIGDILRRNKRMLDMTKALGFTTHSVPGEEGVHVQLDLRPLKIASGD
jgi:acetyltransferase